MIYEYGKTTVRLLGSTQCVLSSFPFLVFFLTHLPCSRLCSSRLVQWPCSCKQTVREGRGLLPYIIISNEGQVEEICFCENSRRHQFSLIKYKNNYLYPNVSFLLYIPLSTFTTTPRVTPNNNANQICSVMASSCEVKPCSEGMRNL